MADFEKTTTLKIILVVEDEPHIQQLIQTNLERAGYGVLQAMTGHEGLAAVEAQRPDLILLDMTLPDMTTVEFATLLKRNPSNRSLPVFILSPPPEEIEVYQGGWDGIEAYLRKPFDPMDLIYFVKRIFGEPDAVPPKWYPFGVDV